MRQFKFGIIPMFMALVLCAPAGASQSSEIEKILKAAREVSAGHSVPGGLRPFLDSSLVENPRLALPELNDTEFVRRLDWYAPFARAADDRAAAAMGLWIAYNAETISAAPQQVTSAGRVKLVWPGSSLFLDRTRAGLRIAGSAETAAAPPALASPLPPYRRLTIVFTNDIHGSLLPYPAPWSKSETRPMVGAMASAATFVRWSRTVDAALAVPLFLFDAGDMYQGTPEGTLTRGSAMIPVMNALRYDAITVGNHDYDHGRQNAERLVADLQAPVFGANVFDTATGKLEKGLKRFLILDRGGIRLGLTGLLTTKMSTLTFEKNIRGLEFRPQIQTLAEILPTLRAAHPDLTILISHTGFEEDKALADSVPGMDVIIGGHSHTPVDTAWIGANKTLVVQTAGKASSIGRLDLLLTPAGGVDTFVWQLVPLYMKGFPEDPQMKKTIQAATRGVADEMARVIGRSETDVPYAYRQESAMGRLTTDILRNWAHADVAILAGGGMRAGFIPGPLAVRDCFQVFPFGNPLAVADVSGDLLSRVLEYGVSTERGRIQLSGVTLLADTSLSPGRRLIEARVGGVPLDRTRTYRIVTDGFLAQGGSGYFAGEKISWDIVPEKSPFDLLRDYVAQVGTVQPDTGARIQYR